MTEILVVEDDPELSAMIAAWLSTENYDCKIITDGLEASITLKYHQYDLVLLDLELPRVSGLEILTELRRKGGVTPVMVLTGRRLVEDKVSCLHAGADDYLTKPFDGRELLARVKALTRRSSNYTNDALKAGNLVLFPQEYRVTKDGEEIHLLPKEFALLEFLMHHPRRVFSSEALLAKIWEKDSDSSIDAVTTCIKRLRRKIGEQGRASIKSVYGVGYKLESP
jgi:DNA-binding response OmpR family regulator